MKTYSCDVCGTPRLTQSEVTTFKVGSPGRAVLMRGELHSCRACLPAVGKAFSISVVSGLDPFSVDVSSPALVVRPVKARGARKGTKGKAG